jgi:ribosomal protein L7Ae-like RNA K-turn-binding protein
LAQRAGFTLFGLDQIKKLIYTDKVSIVFYTEDLGKSSLRTIQFMRKNSKGIRFIQVPESAMMATLFGSSKIKIAGIAKSGIADKIISANIKWSVDGKKEAV